MTKTRSAGIDAYVSSAAPFARPILKHLRELVHAGCPEVAETMKWRMPFFVHGGRNLCHMAAFKAHCAFGFWHADMRQFVDRETGKSGEAMGSLGRIAALADLPPDRTLVGYVQRAAALNASGLPAHAVPKRRTRPALPVPRELCAALAGHPEAAATFSRMSRSHRREYIEWITGAKRDETRRRRLETAVAWLAEGRSLNWRYANR